ncbi:MAG: hypothetical protein EB084_19240 [Proteobacteria bacterium]|nr:hypothetical protein [Pseudomonadota bacterium]
MEMLLSTAVTLVGNKQAQTFVKDTVNTLSAGAKKLARTMRRAPLHHVRATPLSARTSMASDKGGPSTRAAAPKDVFTPTTQSAADRRHAEQQAQLKQRMAGLRSGQLLAERQADGRLVFLPNPNAPEKSVWAAHADYLANGYGTDVMNFGHGEVMGMGSVLKDTVEGLAHVAMNPRATAAAVSDAVTDAAANPLATARRGASWARETLHDVAKPFVKGDMEGMGQVFGKGLGHAGVLFGGGMATRAAATRMGAMARTGVQRVAGAASEATTRAVSLTEAGASRLSDSARWLGGQGRELLDELKDLVGNVGRGAEGGVTSTPVQVRSTAVSQIANTSGTQAVRSTSSGVRYLGRATDLTESLSRYTPTGVDSGSSEWLSNMDRLRRMAQGGR